MESDDILDQSQENQVDSIDIRDLLDVANAKVFDDDHDLISKTKNFEKVASFFDLIKSDTVAEPESVESDFSSILNEKSKNKSHTKKSKKMQKIVFLAKIRIFKKCFEWLKMMIYGMK